MKRRGLIFLLVIIANATLQGQDNKIKQLLEAGDTLTAIKVLKDPEYFGEPWQKFYNLGILYFETGEMDSAHFYLNNSLLFNSKQYQAHYYLGHYYYQSDQMEKAVDHFSKYLVEDPESRETRHFLAQSLMKAKDHYAAITEWSRLINEEPSAGLYYNRALTRLVLNDLEGSRSDLQKAIELKPGYMDAYYYMGVSFTGSYDEKIAQKWFEKGSKIDPTDTRMLTALARLYKDRGKEKKACKYIRLAQEEGWKPTEDTYLDILETCK